MPVVPICLLCTFSFMPVPVPQLKFYICSFFRSSSPDSLTNERGDNKSPASSQVSPSGLYKLVVPLLRCEATDVRDAAVQALGRVNVDALKYVFFSFALLDLHLPY